MTYAGTAFPLIRPATAADAQLLAEIGAETFTGAYAASLPAAELAAFVRATFSPALQAAELSAPGTRFLILEVAGEPAGYATLRDRPAPVKTAGARDLELARIYLRPHWIGQGLGTRLMQACLDITAETGSNGLWLGVWEENERALSFYRKWGFTEVGSVSFPFGDALQTDLVLWRQVGERTERENRDGQPSGSKTRPAK